MVRIDVVGSNSLRRQLIVTVIFNYEKILNETSTSINFIQGVNSCRTRSTIFCMKVNNAE